jgi:hypothetical protein
MQKFTQAEWLAGAVYLMDTMLIMLTARGVLTHAEAAEWLDDQARTATESARSFAEWYARHWRTRLD